MKPIIGFLTYDGADNWISTIWSGVVDAAKKQQASLISFSTRQLWDSAEGLEDNLAAYDQICSRVDGLISTDIATPWVKEKLKPFLSKPSVLINFTSGEFTSVSVDYYGGMKSAAEHLIRHHGFKRIAYIRGPVQSDTELRYKAYLEALEGNGIARDDRLISEPCAHQGYEDGFAAMNRLLDVAGAKIEAVLASNDDIAIGAIRALESRNIRTPWDIAVIGFDDKIEAASSNPPLSSVRAPIYEMGYRAVEILIEKMNRVGGQKSEIIPTRFVARRSCGCATKSVEIAGHASQRFGSRLEGLLLHQGRYLPGLKSIKPSFAASASERLPELDPILGADWPDAACDSLIEDMRGTGTSSLIRTLDSFLARIEANGLGLSTLQDVISILRQSAVPVLSVGRRAALRAENIFNAARTFVAEVAVQQQMRENLVVQTREERIRSAGQKFVMSFDLSELAAVIQEELPKLGIREGYLAIFKDRASPPAKSTMMLAFREGAAARAKEEAPFSTGEILPAFAFDSPARIDWVVWPLNYQDEKLGYFVFGLGPRERATYLALSVQLACALKGALLVKEIHDHSERLAGGIEDITVTLDEMARNISSIAGNMENQASAVEQGARSIEAMAANVDRTAAVSIEVRDLSYKLNAAATDGGNAVGSSIDSIGEVAKSSQQIVDLLELIKGIAGQTNTLALNAEIEAAHAGDSGKGFSVVAAEIRALSNGTNENVKNIEAVVRAIVDKIKDSATLTEKAGSGLEDILSYAKRNADMAVALDSAMDSQGRDAKEMLSATKELVRITEEVKDSMVEQKRATDAFNDALRLLKAKTD